MSDQAASYSDDLELFDILHTLWDGKTIVLLAAAAGLALGWFVGQLLPAKYSLTIPASINYHSLKSEYLCAELFQESHITYRSVYK